ncbi:Nuclease SbcCD subunit C [compost metagenome]
MKLRNISVKNLASYKEESFNFDETGDLFAVIGPNGGGKSTFFVESMTIALFNRSRSSTSIGTGVEKMINLGEDELEITFEFEIGGQYIKVTRRRFLKGGQELELFIDGVNHTDKVKETQAKLESLIKMDFETFLDSVCISQGKSGNFMEKPANERKDVFTQILSLDKYDVLQDFTKTLRKENKDKISKAKEKLEEISESVKAKNQYENEILQGKVEITKISFDIEEKDRQLELEVKEKILHDQLVKNRNDILRTRQNLEIKINSTTDSIEKFTTMKYQYENVIISKEETLKLLQDFSTKAEVLTAQYHEMNNQKSTLEGTNNVLNGQAKEIKGKYTRLKDYDDASCNFCGQAITESHKQKHLDEMMSEAKGYMLQIKNNGLVVTELLEKMTAIKSEINSINSQVQSLQQKKSQIEQAELKLANIDPRIQELSQELVNIQFEYNESMLLPVEDVTDKVFQDAFIKMELNNLRNQLTNWQNKVAIAKNELEKIAKEESNIKKLENQLKELQEEYALLDDLTTAWGKDGIQAIIIDNSLEDIQDEINDVLSSLTSDQVSIEFITQKEKGKGKKATSIETLDIMVNGQDGSRAYETYSGGEKFRIDFSCHVGLAKFLAKRAGAAIDFFIVDEGIGSQDEVAKENFVAVMNKLTSIFNKVMVITHIPDVIDAFHHKVEIYKDPIKGSKIKILS